MKFDVLMSLNMSLFFIRDTLDTKYVHMGNVISAVHDTT